MCKTILEEVQKQNEEPSECISRLLDHVMSCAMDENLMDVAKETGKQLYANMSQEDKIDKINLMVKFSYLYISTDFLFTILYFFRWRN